MTLRLRLAWMVLGVVGVSVCMAVAQESDKPVRPNTVEQLKTGARPAAATIEAIMEQAVHNIAMRYNLNDVQTEETGELMRRGVRRFLEEHEKEVWPVIRDLLASQLHPPDDREKMMRIGKLARPLAQAAKEAIFRANEEWRLYLTPEQRTLHDFDLAEMQTTFGQIDENFLEWEQGRATDKSIFGNPDLAGRQPPRPYRPPDGGLPEPPRVVFDPNRVFAALVEEFIREYRLDKGQITTARSILEEFKGRASNYRDTKKRELEEFDARQRQAMKDRNLSEVKKVVAERKVLLKPVYGLCAEMDQRLKSMLTTEQIQRHAERNKPQKEEVKTPKAQKEASTPKESTEKTTVPKSEPAKTKSAKSDAGTDTGN